MKRSVFLLFALIFAPAALVILGADSLIYVLNKHKLEDLAATNSARVVEKAQRIISAELAVALKDLTYLAFVHESCEVFKGDINQDLEDTFMSIIYNRGDYDQIRYLSPTGEEKFRINFNEGSPHIVRPHNLQIKNDRYYFSPILHLELDELYISPMDLNIEHGEIESPHKPTLRLGSPIWNTDGHTIGILIINFRGKAIFDALDELNEESCCNVMLLNEDGYLLNSEQEWNFIEKQATNPPTFPADHPGTWKTITANHRGQFLVSEQLFTYATMDLDRTIEKSTRLLGEHTAPVWKVVAITPPVTDSPELAQVLNRITLFSLPLLLISAVVAYRLAHLRTRSRMAEQMVKRQMESNARFVPNEFLGLLDKGELTEVGISDNVQQYMTTMFTDIRSYTKLSEGMTAEEVLDFLNEYYGVLDPVISEHHGFIDAFIGDAVMALFPDNAENAVKAVIDIRKALTDFRYKKNNGEILEVGTGYGLHCGDVTLGAVGTDHRLQTTAIGDTVNLASRIESATKLYGASIIISGAVKNALPAPDKFHLRSIDLVRVKGKQEVVELFEIFDTDSEDVLKAKSTNLGMFTLAMANYRRGEFEQALEKFQKLKEACPEDKVLDIFMKRSNTMMRIPPGDGWTGVSTL